MRLFRVVFAVLVLQFGASMARAEPPPLSAYGQLPAIEEVDLSPDGSNLAVVTTLSGKRQLVALNAEGKVITSIPLADQKIRGIQWAGNDFLIVYMSTTNRLYPGAIKQEFTAAAVLNLKSGGKP